MGVIVRAASQRKSNWLPVSHGPGSLCTQSTRTTPAKNNYLGKYYCELQTNDVHNPKNKYCCKMQTIHGTNRRKLILPLRIAGGFLRARLGSRCVSTRTGAIPAITSPSAPSRPKHPVQHRTDSGTCNPPLVIAGFCWLLLAIAGFCWLLLVIAGCCWLLLVIALHGSFRPGFYMRRPICRWLSTAGIPWGRAAAVSAVMVLYDIRVSKGAVTLLGWVFFVIPFGSPHVLRAHMGHTCGGGANEIEFTAAHGFFYRSLPGQQGPTFQHGGGGGSEDKTHAHRGQGARREPFDFTPAGVNSISPAHLHIQTTGRTCRWAGEIKKDTHPKDLPLALFRDQAVGMRAGALGLVLPAARLQTAARSAHLPRSAAALPLQRGFERTRRPRTEIDPPRTSHPARDTRHRSYSNPSHDSDSIPRAAHLIATLRPPIHTHTHTQTHTHTHARARADTTPRHTYTNARAQHPCVCPQAFRLLCFQHGTRKRHHH